MASVPDLLPYFQLVGQVALILGATFAGYQFLLHRRERNDAAALSVLTSLQSAEFRAAYTTVWELRLGATAEEVKACGKEMESAADIVMMTFESLGVMVHNRIVPIDLVDQVIGGFLRESWRRLEAYVKEKRVHVGSKRLGEWYQWLAEHLAVQTRRSEGAYQAFKEWKE